MTYEEYKEQEMSIIMWGDDSEMDALAANYPEHAARAKQEANARRGCTYEEYQQKLASFPPVHLVHNQDGDVEYVYGESAK